NDPMPGLTALTCDRNKPVSLLPGETLTCTAEYTAGYADFDRGHFTNTATADAKQPNGTPLDQVSDSARVEALSHPALAITNTPDVPSVNAADDLVGYTFVATNTGNTTAHNVVITVPQDGLYDFEYTVSGKPVTGPVTLLPGESLVMKARYRAKQGDVNAGKIVNLATVTGDYVSHERQPDPNDPNKQIDVDVMKPIDPASAPSTVVADPVVSMTLNKTADQELVKELGALVGYTFTSTNKGNVTMAVDTVNDSHPGFVLGSCTPALPAQLAPGETIVCQGTYAVSQSDLDAGTINNTATISARTPANLAYVTEPSSAVVKAAQTAAATLAKVSSITDTNGNGMADEGETITYTLKAQNTGTVTLPGATISDPMLGSGLQCSPAIPTDLAPGATITCVGAHVVTRDEANATSLTNKASLTSTGATAGNLTVGAENTVKTTPKKALADTGFSFPRWPELLNPSWNVVVSNTLKVGPAGVAGWIAIMAVCMMVTAARPMRGKENE
ncbi:MAG: DUF7507 domain-containing protein, partial [Propionibacteriaceae bacterium]